MCKIATALGWSSIGAPDIYRLALGVDIEGFITIDGEEKRIREHERGRLKVTLFEAHRIKSEAEFSRIVIRYRGSKVFEIRWNELRDFKTVAFEPGDEWEEALIAESEANYF